MFKMKKTIILIAIVILCAITLAIKSSSNSKEDIYVLTEDNNEVSIEDNSQNEIDEKQNISNEKITVYISGQVEEPGIVTLNKGDRLATAVEKVGGATKEADLNKVNMAIKIEDEMHYIIPKIGEDSEVGSSSEPVSTDEKSNSSKININKATIAELEELPGVGEATANKIINYRSENGAFKSIEEIKNVNGIGDKKYADMKDLIDIN